MLPRKNTVRVGSLTTLALMIGVAAAHASARPPADVDAARLGAADSEPQNWFTAGRDQDGTYYSPLAAIDAKNVK
jgi:quinohemoprotein ethanol dehydrogenase